MKKKIVTILMTAAIGTSLLAGQAVMAADTETATEAKADDTGDSKETEEEKTIGKKPETDKDAEGVFSLKFKNLTGKVITEVTVKNEKDEKYPDNFLEKGETASNSAAMQQMKKEHSGLTRMQTQKMQQRQQMTRTQKKHLKHLSRKFRNMICRLHSKMEQLQHFIHFRLAIQRKRNFIWKEKLLILYLTARI